MSFDAMPHDVWPEVAGLIPRPWPRSVAAHDLRWHAAEHAVYGRPLPAVRELTERWGWTRTRTHELIADAPGWADEARPWGWRAADKKRTTGGQEADTANGRTPTNIETADKIRTAGGQDPDSRADPISAPLHPSPFTQDIQAAMPPAETPPKAPTTQRPDPAADTLLVWKAYRVHHAGGRETLPAAAKKYIPGALRELSAEALIRIIDWAHLSPDNGAHYLRGDAWEAGKGSGDFLGIDNLLRYEKLDGRDQKARAWEAEGRPNFRDARSGAIVGSHKPGGSSMMDKLRAAMQQAAARVPDEELEVINAK